MEGDRAEDIGDLPAREQLLERVAELEACAYIRQPLRATDERDPEGRLLEDPRECRRPESRIARRDLADEVAAIKSEPGDDVIAYGGAMFARALVRERLVDEYRLVIQPAALGHGLPLFTELTEPLYLELVDSHSYRTGAAIHVYRPRD